MTYNLHCFNFVKFTLFTYLVSVVINRTHLKKPITVLDPFILGRCVFADAHILQADCCLSIKIRLRFYPAEQPRHGINDARNAACP